MPLNTFDSIAPLYDKLASLVFGKAIVKAQQINLKSVKAGATVLILGGGTGWILKDLFNIADVARVYYIDASREMIRRASLDYKSYTRITFIHGTEEDIPEGIFFDAVITGFYLDLFTDDQLNVVVQRIKASLRHQALWLVTDFSVEGKWCYRTMLRIMYIFFRVTCNLGVKKLPDWPKALQGLQLVKTDEHRFYGDFIISSVYQARAPLRLC